MASSGGAIVVQPDEPILRRVLATEDLADELVLEFDTGNPVVYLVASEGIYDVLTLEGGTLPIGLMTEDSNKFILTVY